MTYGEAIQGLKEGKYKYAYLDINKEAIVRVEYRPHLKYKIVWRIADVFDRSKWGLLRYSSSIPSDFVKGYKRSYFWTFDDPEMRLF